MQRSCAALATTRRYPARFGRSVGKLAMEYMSNYCIVDLDSDSDCCSPCDLEDVWGSSQTTAFGTTHAWACACLFSPAVPRRTSPTACCASPRRWTTGQSANCRHQPEPQTTTSKVCACACACACAWTCAHICVALPDVTRSTTCGKARASRCQAA